MKKNFCQIDFDLCERELVIKIRSARLDYFKYQHLVEKLLAGVFGTDWQHMFGFQRNAIQQQKAGSEIDAPLIQAYGGQDMPALLNLLSGTYRGVFLEFFECKDLDKNIVFSLMYDEEAPQWMVRINMLQIKEFDQMINKIEKWANRENITMKEGSVQWNVILDNKG